MNQFSHAALVLGVLASPVGIFAACGGGSVAAGGSGGSGGTGGSTSSSNVDCASATTDIEKLVCASNGFLANLSTDQLPLVNLAITDTASRTKWSNLPGTERAGVKMGDLSATDQANALAMMAAVLSTQGKANLDGVRAADDYLGSLQGGGSGGPGGGAYSSDNYSVAVFGTPSATGTWSVSFGGHHMAFMVTYIDGVGYPVPNHLGVEPKAEFTIDGASYTPMKSEGEAMVAVFDSLSTDDLSTGYLQGQSFSDVVIGPVEYGTGSDDAAKAKYPTGTSRTGVLVSTLTADQQALVTAAITQWVGDFDTSVSSSLLATYTSADAFADTYVAWGGAEDAGVDVDVDGTYMRIDGPRVWIEVACQAGVVVQGKTHFHSIYRDKQFDYGATL